VRDELAENLLTKVMNWSDAEKAAERAFLQDIARYKYTNTSSMLRVAASLKASLSGYDKCTPRRSVGPLTISSVSD
jgi:hypothetical protein